MRRWITYIRWIGFLLPLWLPQAWASDSQLSLHLATLQAEAITEERGDEVYLSISKYSNKNPPEEFRVPSKPLNWFFKKMDSIKNINLWEGKISEDETLKLVISVVEQDIPPWDVDDLIGTVQVNIQYAKSDRPQVTWMIPKMDGQPEIDDLGPVQDHGRHYVLRGENSKYDLVLHLHVGR